MSRAVMNVDEGEPLELGMPVRDWSANDGATISVTGPGALKKPVAGRYRLLRFIAAGGAGAVYEARETTTLRRCAVKLLTRVGSDPDVLARFVNEARTTAQIESDHIVQVFDTGMDPESGRPYIAMELLRGEDLKCALNRLGPLEPMIALRLALQAAIGLSRAHRLGVVHRDVKPANLFLSTLDSGGICVKVLDFGIAKVKAEVGLELNQITTRSGGIIGTPRYMSPEQVQGERQIDARTDVWSLGVVLFEMLSGKLPFPEHTSVTELIAAVLTTEPRRLSSAAPAVPAAVAELVDIALSRDPARRFADAEVFGRALTRVAGNGHVPALALLAPDVVSSDSGATPSSGPVEVGTRVELANSVESSRVPARAFVYNAEATGSGTTLQSTDSRPNPRGFLAKAAQSLPVGALGVAFGVLLVFGALLWQQKPVVVLPDAAFRPQKASDRDPSLDVAIPSVPSAREPNPAQPLEGSNARPDPEQGTGGVARATRSPASAASAARTAKPRSDVPARTTSGGATETPSTATPAAAARRSELLTSHGEFD